MSRATADACSKYTEQLRDTSLCAFCACPTLSLFSCVCVCCTLTVCGAKLSAATYRRATGVFRKRSLEGKKLEILQIYLKQNRNVG